MTRDPSDARLARLAPCDGCGSRYDRCRCDAAGDAFARQHGERLPAISDGRLLGGHVEDASRGGLQQLGRVLDKQAASRELRHFAEFVRARLAYIEGLLSVLPGERRRRTDQARILAMMFDGEGMRQADIAKAVGRNRQWVNSFVAEIRAEVYGRTQAGEVLTALCPCGREFGVMASACGRPRRFCERSCAKKWHENLRTKERIFRRNTRRCKAKRRRARKT